MDTSEKAELYRCAGCLVRKISRRSINGMREEYGSEISHAEFRVILYVSKKEGVSLGNLADRWSMHMSNLTKVVNSLVEKGYAVKKVSDSDKRVKLLFLTKKGEGIKSRYIKEFESRIDKFLEKADEDSIRIAVESINDILNQIKGET